MGVASSISALGYMLPMGLADAVVTLVSNELGAHEVGDCVCRGGGGMRGWV